MTADLRGQLQATLGTAFTLERELGGGGMSRVFVATETRLRRSVVVKVLSSELAAGVSADRFEREIQLAASLQQANIVPLLSAGETEGIPYYTMPFVEGESLRARLVKDGRLPIAECVGILRDVARALSYAHTHGVVHRDIKPDNILLSHGAAMVADFGIAKAISAARTQSGDSTLTQAGTSIGTPTYMAPEQVAGDATADHRVDLYAFGCVAYELLSGRPPFTDPLPQKVLAAHLSVAPQPLREIRPEVPTALATVVMRCLEKQATDRPASADELLRSLDAIATPSGGFSTGVAAATRSRPSWMRPALIAATALAMIAIGGIAVKLGRSGAGGVGGSDKSIAVMPLANLSGDPANDYFGEGLAEEITGALAKAGLHVIGRGSARALAARGLDARAVAKELGVGTVLQGTVQRDGDRVRISVTLTSGSDGSVLWTEKYDRKLADVFAVQDEIARRVATQLKSTLGGAAGTALVRQETSDPEAHSLYLQGLYLWNRRTAPAIRQAIGLFQQAVTRDLKYGRAHAGIALAEVVLPYYEDGSTDSLAAKGREAAARALAIDSTLAEAWSALAFANAYQWKNADAERDFARAIQMDSTFATARFWHGLLLNHVGRYDEALAELARARTLEPTSLVIQTGSAQVVLAQRKIDAYASAEASLRATLALDSTFATGRAALANIFAQTGRLPEAVALFRVLTTLPGVRPSEIRSGLAYVLANSGATAEARRVIDSLRTEGHGTLPPTGTLAAALMALGEREPALAVLKQAVDRHDPWMLNYSRSKKFDELRKDPRGKALLERTESP